MISKIKPFINKYDWIGIKYPSKLDDWKTFQKNNSTIALNVSYIKEKETHPVYISNDPKQRKRRLALSHSKKIICIITWNNFLLFKLSTFF